MASFPTKHWGKIAFSCSECNYTIHKTWIEPMWMIRDFIEKDHAWYHEAATNPESHPLTTGWREFERNRIIKLLEDNWVEPMDWLSVEALIKGEQK